VKHGGERGWRQETGDRREENIERIMTLTGQY
jgi:hypothetical protein